MRFKESEPEIVSVDAHLLLPVCPLLPDNLRPLSDTRERRCRGIAMRVHRPNNQMTTA